MDFYSFVQGPLLWIVFLVFLAGLLIRLFFFSCSIIRSSRDKDKRQVYTVATFGRFFLPFHKAVVKKPIYATLRYIFHLCMLVVPLWFSGHVVLWAESRFEWEWVELPDAWADWMTIILLGLATYFLVRRIIIPEIRLNSSKSDYILIIITALPFMTGYFLTHGTLDSVSFLGDSMGVIHMLSGEAMILMAVFLFCRTRLNTQRCTGCASCVQNCPTETLEFSDKGKLRVFTYSHFQCICCGSCVNVCPEDAAELRHEISAKRLFQVFSKQEIRSVELEACERCGALFAPEPQMEKIGLTFAHDYIKFCPNCRKANIGDMLHQLSPWHKSTKKAGETLLKTAPPEKGF